MTKQEMHEEFTRRMDETSAALLEYMLSCDTDEEGKREFYRKRFKETEELLNLMHNYILEQIPATNASIAWWVYALGNLSKTLESTLKEDGKQVLEALRGFCCGSSGQVICVEVPGGELNE